MERNELKNIIHFCTWQIKLSPVLNFAPMLFFSFSLNACMKTFHFAPHLSLFLTEVADILNRNLSNGVEKQCCAIQKADSSLGEGASTFAWLIMISCHYRVSFQNRNHNDQVCQMFPIRSRNLHSCQAKNDMHIQSIMPCRMNPNWNISL